MAGKNTYVERVGEYYQTEYGSEIEIIEYNSSYDITVRISNMMNNGEMLSYTKKSYYYMFKNKKIKSNLDYNINDIACIGVPIEGEEVRLTECSVFHRYKNLCAYISSNEYSLDESFDSFYKFKYWYDKNVYRDKSEKIVLSNYNGNIYGKDTCLFIPLKIANVLSRNAKLNNTSRGYHVTITKGISRIELGFYNNRENALKVYENAKEKYIKELIMKYRDILSEDAYNKLLNYKLMNKINLEKEEKIV